MRNLPRSTSDTTTTFIQYWWRFVYLHFGYQVESKNKTLRNDCWSSHSSFFSMALFGNKDLAYLHENCKN